ncbi:MAG TPA: hypothetical protein VK752_29465 [Bryobacteraceae bacterium]|nr:hypothetical protein [Bryobacteraceae bacterium]
MNQALHIFKKDVRCLRWELAASMVLMAIFVYGQIYRDVLLDNRAAIVSYILLCFWAFLCARLVQAEPIPGDRQFWITRPYQWRSLLGAKLLFMVVFIGVPLLAADAVILRVEGFSIASHAVGLLWSLVLITASTLIAFCAFATLTRNLTEWFLAAIITVGIDYAIAAIANERVWAGVEWIRDYSYVAIMCVVAAVVLLAQYTRRGTIWSIVVMAVGLLGSAIFVNYARSSWALELETRFSNPRVDLSSVRIAAAKVEPAAPTIRPIPPKREQVVLLAIPLDVSGLKDGLDLISDEVQVTIKNENGGNWSRGGRQANDSNYLQRTPKGHRLLLRVDGLAFERAADPVEVSLTLYLTMLRDSASRVIQPRDAAVDVPGSGRCQDVAMERDNWIVCESALRAPPNLLVVGFKGERRDRFFAGTSYSPFPADADSAIVPLGRYSHSVPRDLYPVTLTSLEPVAHFRMDLKLPNVHLADYRVPSQF